MTRHVPIGGTHPDLFLIGPGDMEVLLLTSIGPSISATTESLQINLGETTHPQWTFQGLLPCVGQFILKGRMSILFSLWLWLKQWCWFWRCLSFPIRCVLTGSGAEKECWMFFKLSETGLNTTSSSPWLAVHLQYIWSFLPFVDSDGSKFPWLCSFYISSRGPFSFWIGSDLQLSVLSPSDCFQTCKRLFWNSYQTASLSDKSLSKSSTKLYFLANPLPLSLLKKKKNLKKLAIAYKADQERKCFLVLSCLLAWGCFLLPYALHTSSERQRLSF